jgi:beta-phosphoglucomutase
MFDAVIFDFDGVLYHSEPIHLEASQRIFDQFNITVDEHIFLDQYVGLSDHEIFDVITRAHGHKIDADQIDELIKLKTHEYHGLIKQNKHLDSRASIETILQRLADQKIKIAICSNAIRSEIDVVLSRLENGNIKKYFDIITSIEDVKRGKPHPEGYLLTSKRIGVAPENCIVIEDTVNGIRAAKRAGMRVFGITGTLPAERLTEADHVIHELSEIFEPCTRSAS